MNVTRVAGVIAAGILLAGASVTVSAQTYPHKPMRMIAAQAAGGGTDFIARAVAQKLGEAWGQTVIVENRPGAAGGIGTEIAVKAAADGYTLLLSSSGPIVINPGLYKLGYDPVRDLAAAGLVATAPLVLVVHPVVPARTVKELIAVARDTRSKLNYGSGGSGSPPHLAAELFKSMTGSNMLHIPFKGSAPSVGALIAGQVDLTFATVLVTLPQVKVGRVRALAVSTPNRSQAAPELPTIAEAGVPGFQAQQWYGMFAPAKTSAEILGKLAAEVHRIAALPDVRARLAADGAEPSTLNLEQFRDFIRADAARWAKVIKDSGAKAE
jgi:tripartite-type tricarboxylate transporter receptor subunit TctC